MIFSLLDHHFPTIVTFLSHVAEGHPDTFLDAMAEMARCHAMLGKPSAPYVKDSVRFYNDLDNMKETPSLQASHDVTVANANSLSEYKMEDQHAALVRARTKNTEDGVEELNERCRRLPMSAIGTSLLRSYGILPYRRGYGRSNPLSGHWELHLAAAGELIERLFISACVNAPGVSRGTRVFVGAKTDVVELPHHRLTFPMSYILGFGNAPTSPDEAARSMASKTAASSSTIWGGRKSNVRPPLHPRFRSTWYNVGKPFGVSIVKISGGLKVSTIKDPNGFLARIGVQVSDVITAAYVRKGTSNQYEAVTWVGADEAQQATFIDMIKSGVSVWVEIPMLHARKPVESECELACRNEWRRMPLAHRNGMHAHQARNPRAPRYRMSTTRRRRSSRCSRGASSISRRSPAGSIS